MPRVIYKNSEGKRVPSVTTILGKNLGWNKDALVAWAKKQGSNADKISSEALDAGTVCHGLIDAYMKNEPFLFDDFNFDAVVTGQRGFDTFKVWAIENIELPINTEVSLVHDNLSYGGTYDALVRLKDGSLALLDFKTSKGIYDEYIAQLAAYRHLLMHNDEENTPDKCIIIKIPKTFNDDDSVTIFELSDEQIEYGWKLFHHCLELEKIRNYFIQSKRRKNE